MEVAMSRCLPSRLLMGVVVPTLLAFAFMNMLDLFFPDQDLAALRVFAVSVSCQ